MKIWVDNSPVNFRAGAASKSGEGKVAVRGVLKQTPHSIFLKMPNYSKNSCVSIKIRTTRKIIY